jgi:hypothetical protein
MERDQPAFALRTREIKKASDHFMDGRLRFVAGLPAEVRRPFGKLGFWGGRSAYPNKSTVLHEYAGEGVARQLISERRSENEKRD